MSELNNLISVQIPPKDQAAIMRKLGELEVLLAPYLVALTAEERKVLPKMSDGNAPFVDKALQHAQANPTLAPAFLDVNELEVDLKAVNDLSKIFRKADKLCSGLSDTIMLSGSEAFVAALAFYNSVKVASQMNIQGAKSVYDDLKKRFDANGRRSQAGPQAEV